MNIKRIFHLTIRFIVGLFFITSGSLKLISIDSFEIYIYSFGIFNLKLSFLFARFIISLELLSGILITIGFFLKKTTFYSIILLSFFSIFIAYLYLSNNEEHCHCFGDIIELSLSFSFIKNIILLVLLIIINKNHEINMKFKKLVLITSTIVSISLPLILSPPDFFFYNKYSKGIDYNDLLLDEFLTNNNQYKKGKQILSFYGTSCKFCKLASQKISVIANKAERNEMFSNIFWGTEDAIQTFFETTKSTKFNYSSLKADKFLRITNGKMPLIICIDNGVVKAKYGYRNINENEFMAFINSK